MKSWCLLSQVLQQIGGVQTALHSPHTPRWPQAEAWIGDVCTAFGGNRHPPSTPGSLIHTWPSAVARARTSAWTQAASVVTHVRLFLTALKSPVSTSLYCAFCFSLLFSVSSPCPSHLRSLRSLWVFEVEMYLLPTSSGTGFVEWGGLRLGLPTPQAM